MYIVIFLFLYILIVSLTFANLNKKLMILWCFKDNIPSIKFYEKMGGRIISEKVKEHGGKENYEVCFAYDVQKLISNL